MFSKQSKDKVVLLIDVQSSVVRSSLILISSGSPPYVFSMNEWPVPHMHIGGMQRLVTMTIKMIGEAVDSARRILYDRRMQQKELVLPESISEIHFVLSSPWIISRARTITEVFQKPTIISRELIDGIIVRERDLDVANDVDGIEIIEEKIFDVRLNGYSVVRWEDKTADKLRISFAVSVAGSDTMKYLRDICSGIVRDKDVYFHSSLLLQHIGIRSILPDQNNYLLIHIHGELTDAVMVEHGTCMFFGSFPLGINNIVRSIGSATHTSQKVANSLLSLYIGKHLDQSDLSKSSIQAIEHMEKVWTAELRKLLLRSSCTDHLPRMALITSRLHEDFFISNFEAAYPKINIGSFAAEQLTPFVSFIPHIEMLRLTGLYAIAVNNISHV